MSLMEMALPPLDVTVSPCFRDKCSPFLESIRCSLNDQSRRDDSIRNGERVHILMHYSAPAGEEDPNKGMDGLLRDEMEEEGEEGVLKKKIHIPSRQG
uniref:Uncharacterized protein n=1 Tax=Pristionchus pacificus TaxID=54126 RepID=A0A2A6BXI6_PRIPA|eukprot:PDM70615.1 hypothetical protein PRIPAC_46861 [Pristionchus pacificus]